MKTRSGFVSNSSSSSFVCTFIGIPSNKIIKQKGDKIFINGENVDHCSVDEYSYLLDAFFQKHKVKLAAVGNSIGYILKSQVNYSDGNKAIDVNGDLSAIGDLEYIKEKFDKATIEFKKIGYEGQLKTYLYSEV
jgi:hypothetical protein